MLDIIDMLMTEWSLIDLVKYLWEIFKTCKLIAKDFLDTLWTPYWHIRDSLLAWQILTKNLTEEEMLLNI